MGGEDAFSASLGWWHLFGITTLPGSGATAPSGRRLEPPLCRTYYRTAPLNLLHKDLTFNNKKKKGRTKFFRLAFEKKEFIRIIAMINPGTTREAELFIPTHFATCS
ncbi:unnamed protein product [Lepidochelys kempii]